MSIRFATFCAVSGALLAVNTAPALGQRSHMTSGGHTSDVGIGVRASTLGAGVELSKLLASHLGVRVGANFYSLTLRDKKQSDIAYTVNAKASALSALLDLYPSARGAFHLTGGVMTSPWKVTATGTPTSGQFTINGNTYTAAQVGTLTGTGKYASAEPYVGLGFGTAASRHGGLALTFDLGAAIGKPAVTLSASNASSTPGLQADLNAQAAKTQKDLNKLVAFPVIALGLIYRF